MQEISLDFVDVFFFIGLAQGENSFDLSANIKWVDSGRRIEEKRDIAVNFAVVGAVCGVVHTSLVPLRFGVAKGGIYQDKWQSIVPVCVTDVLMGLLGGHVTGLVCRGWLSEYELRARTYFKGSTAGLLGAVVWGSGTSAAWVIATRGYPHSEECKEHDILFYRTLGASFLLNCIGQGIMALISK